jgi:hypothetical protein
MTEEQKQRKKEYQKEYYKKNKKSLTEKQKVYYKNNRNDILEYKKNSYNPIKKGEYNKSYYAQKKDFLINNQKENYLVNRNDILKYKKEFYQQNKDKINQRNIKLERKKYHTNQSFRINRLIRRRFKLALELYSKNGKTQALKEYGIDIKSIVEHLGNPPQDGKVYHIDHIFPVSAFDLNNPEHIKLCWHPNNLQWLEASENMSKGDNYDEIEFKKYLLF